MPDSSNVGYNEFDSSAVVAFEDLFVDEVDDDDGGGGGGGGRDASDGGGGFFQVKKFKA